MVVQIVSCLLLPDWSVIYVGIFFAIVVAAVICSVAFIVCKKKKLKMKLKPRRRYTRLEQNDQTIEMRRENDPTSNPPLQLVPYVFA